MSFCVEDSVVANSDAERDVCEKVGQSVRGLMNPGHDVMPHLRSEVASCWQQIRFDDLANDVVDRKLRETKTANWCRTARSLIPLYISGMVQIFSKVTVINRINSSILRWIILVTACQS